LVPTVEIAATGFCYPGGILQLFSSTKSANFAAADGSSNQIASCWTIIFNNWIESGNSQQNWRVQDHKIEVYYDSSNHRRQQEHISLRSTASGSDFCEINQNRTGYAVTKRTRLLLPEANDTSSADEKTKKTAAICQISYRRWRYKDVLDRDLYSIHQNQTWLGASSDALIVGDKKTGGARGVHL
jgi:hypothetical protein